MSFGSISQMMESIRYNRSLLKRPMPFSKLKESLANEDSIQRGLTYKEVTPEELKRIKTEIRTRFGSI